MKNTVLGFMCQVLHQIHPFYSHSSDRKNHPHPPFKNQIPHPLQTHVWVFHIVISQFPFVSSQQSTAWACGERRLHASYPLPLGWMWGEAPRCGVRPPEGRDPLWERDSLRGRDLLRGYPSWGRLAEGRPTEGRDTLTGYLLKEGSC